MRHVTGEEICLDNLKWGNRVWRHVWEECIKMGLKRVGE